jgi:ferrous iron transport protein B
VPASTAPAATSVLTVVLIGNPNTGKSTVFTGLSGIQTQIGNYPGCTVEKKIGRLKIGGQPIRLVDLPGTYSLSPRSPDEMLAVDVLLGRQPDVGHPDVIVCVADAANLERNLFLFSQLRELNVPVVLCLNMWDAAQRNGISIDVTELEKNLGASIVTTSAHHRRGLPELKEAIVKAAQSNAAPPPQVFPDTYIRIEDEFRAWLATQGVELPLPLVRRAILDVEGEAESRLIGVSPRESGVRLTNARTQVAQAGLRIAAVESLSRYQWIRRQLDGSVQRSPSTKQSATDRIDVVLTHWFYGFIVFTAVMLLVFLAVFKAAQPLMEGVEAAQGWLAGLASSLIAPGTLRSLVNDGVIAGVGSVVVFIPQIGLLFLFIAMLEDCGYMARAAYLVDRVMSKIGLSGRSFLPLMSSFACAIPGVMATRVMENRRDRLTTMLIAPLMSCSARLPVYLLMIAAFIPEVIVGHSWIPVRALTLIAMYSIGALLAIPVAWLFRSTVFKGERPPFVMELPEYKWPSAWIVTGRVLSQVRRFVEEAGTLIFATTVIVWAAGYFPEDHSHEQQLTRQIEQFEAEADAQAEATVASNWHAWEAEHGSTGKPDKMLSEQWRQAAATQRAAFLAEKVTPLEDEQKPMQAELLTNSYLGRTGRFLEPVVKPLGWDWRIGMAAVASFPAREVVIATMGTIFSLGGEIEPDDPDLIKTLQESTWPDGRKLFSTPVAMSLMVFFALCAQCGSTLMVIRREAGSWIWPGITFFYMTALAYLAAWATYAIGMRIGG